MIKFRCEQCGQKIGVPEKLVGRHIKCPRCKHRQLVEADDVPPADSSLVETAKHGADEPESAAAPEPERILRGQTLDLEDKPPETPSEEAEAPAAGKAEKSSLLSLAGIDAETARKIGTRDAKRKTGPAATGKSAGTDDVVVYQLANLPGIVAGFIAVAAGCLIAVGVPTFATLTIAGVAAALAGVGLLMSMTSSKWERWSAIVGISFSGIALGAACAVGALRSTPQPVAVNPGPALPATRPVEVAAAPILNALVPGRARVTVDAVRIAPPELRPDADRPDHTPRLLIYLTIANLSDRPLDYLTWGPGGRTATLSTMNGMQLTPIMYPKGSLLNHPQQSTISPHGQERDVLVYAPIYPTPRQLALDLPCGNIGGVGALHILMPASVGDEKK